MHPMRRASMRQRSAFKCGLRYMDAYDSFDLLTDAAMLDEVESLLPDCRERLLPPTETLAMFLAQAMGADRSCRFAVNTFVSPGLAMGLSQCSTATGEYCRARKRLPQTMVSSLLRLNGNVVGFTSRCMLLAKARHDG